MTIGVESKGRWAHWVLLGLARVLTLPSHPLGVGDAAKSVVLNLRVMILWESQMVLSQGLHIRYLHYHL